MSVFTTRQSVSITVMIRVATVAQKATATAAGGDAHATNATDNHIPAIALYFITIPVSPCFENL